MDPKDAKIIESIPLSRTNMVDRDGRHFTKNGKYTVNLLKVFFWKVRCPQKIKHFLWQLVSGCIAVKKNLQARGLQGDICCARCGASEESINHVFYKCPPVRQIWTLSKIPSNPAIFPTTALFTNIDNLFWRIYPKMDDHQFAWILWYI